MLSARAVRIDTDGPAFPAKTPGRDLKARLENANSIATTVRRRGKNGLFPKTPLHPTPAQSKRLFKDQKSVLGTTTRLKLGDKTPLPNRIFIPQSPSEKVKASKGSNLHVTTLPDSLTDDGDADAESMKRPSSLRKHLKLPTNSAQKNFETPMNNGRHWESDGEIDVSDLQPEVQDMKIVEDDIGSDEIEYCAPNTLDLPYQPPFDFGLPDYKEVGRKIQDLAFSTHFDDALGPPEREFLVNELESIEWETFPLAHLDSDDPFRLARLESKLHKTSTSKQTDSLSHRRTQSSLARLGSASSGMNRFKNAVAPSANRKEVTTPAPLRKQPPKPASDLEGRTSKLVPTTRTVKPPVVQKRTTAAVVQQSRTTGGGANPSHTRPHTSLSLAAKNKATTQSLRNSNPPDSQILDHQLADENFMFDV